MLLVVCPNLGMDRILQVDHFEAGKVQRSRTVLIQPGGKGSNVARVFRQLGGRVVLTGFVGRVDAAHVVEPLRRMGVIMDAVIGFESQSRNCTIICDIRQHSHPTVINEESPEIAPDAAAKLMSRIEHWIPRVDAVLTTGSLAQGLPCDFYAEILDRARCRGKITAIDAAGAALQDGLLTRPSFMKPNAEEFTRLAAASDFSFLAVHTAITFGKAGAALLHGGNCLYAAPPQINDTNPIGAGDSFAAAYLKTLISGASAEECLRWAVATGSCDAGTLRPGFVDRKKVRNLQPHVVLHAFRDILWSEALH